MSWHDLFNNTAQLDTGHTKHFSLFVIGSSEKNCLVLYVVLKRTVWKGKITAFWWYKEVNTRHTFCHCGTQFSWCCQQAFQDAGGWFLHTPSAHTCAKPRRQHDCGWGAVVVFLKCRPPCEAWCSPPCALGNADDNGSIQFLSWNLHVGQNTLDFSYISCKLTLIWP